MTRKRALIVDDSKSARVILSRMLEKFDIEVDTAESAEAAIEYLNGNRPDAIFMDHLMPGMDGLQAVKVIKGNPETAMIPIMMYTSQEGELYVGQARALGAMGVLPKQVRPVDVSKVLYELHLLPDRRDMDDPALAPVELETAAGMLHAVPSARSNGSAGSPGGADWAKRVESAVKDQAVDLRRFMVASLDSFATRIVADLRELAPPAPKPLPPEPAAAPLPPPSRRPYWPWALGVAAAGCICAGLLLLWIQTRDELAQARAELAAAGATNAELARAREQLTQTVKDLTAAVAAAAAGGSTPAAASAGGAITRTELVPYGEAPLERGRVDALRDLLGKLESQGFRGLVKITSGAGIFCLSGNASDGYAPANPTLPFGKCDLVGNPADDSPAGQQRQSLAFANLVAGVRQRTGGAIGVAIDSANKPAVPYPARSETLTAGEWNKAALANNRVDFVAEPGTP
jgi:CheY-like chemotaxis protein